jgi:hypothetical protein
MPTFIVDWSKTYHASGSEKVEADNAGDAEQIIWDKLGDLTGSMQYDGNDDYVEVNEFAS